MEPRNLIVCCDGTNNLFGSENTNVVRLVQTLERDSTRQLVYYDPGVGTLPEPGFVSWLGKRSSEVFGLAFGAGLVPKVGQAYAFLMQHWRPGDRVYLFGFSRGAYSVRTLAALLHMYGLLQAGNENLIPYLLRMFKASRRKLDKSTASASGFWRLCNEFRKTFAQAIPDCDDRRFPIHFMGVWDTVSSVGWLWDPLRFPFTQRNPSVRTIRHAVSLDERRAFFRQNVFALADGKSTQDLVEVWYPGVHADVGGGYPEDEGGLWRETFTWMLGEAQAAGLMIDPVRLQAVWGHSAVPDKPWCERAHRSLTWKWLLAEVFPKLHFRGPGRWRLPHVNLGRPRRIRSPVQVSETVMLRLKDCVPPYRPRPKELQDLVAGGPPFSSKMVAGSVRRTDFADVLQRAVAAAAASPTRR